MKLISETNKQFILYPHLIKTHEGLSIKFLTHPQHTKPLIEFSRVLEIQEILQEKAKELNMVITNDT